MKAGKCGWGMKFLYCDFVPFCIRTLPEAIWGQIWLGIVSLETYLPTSIEWKSRYLSEIQLQNTNSSNFIINFDHKKRNEWKSETQSGFRSNFWKQNWLEKYLNSNFWSIHVGNDIDWSLLLVRPLHQVTSYGY